MRRFFFGLVLLALSLSAICVIEVVPGLASCSTIFIKVRDIYTNQDMGDKNVVVLVRKSGRRHHENWIRVGVYYSRGYRISVDFGNCRSTGLAPDLSSPVHFPKFTPVDIKLMARGYEPLVAHNVSYKTQPNKLIFYMTPQESGFHHRRSPDRHRPEMEQPVLASFNYDFELSRRSVDYTTFHLPSGYSPIAVKVSDYSYYNDYATWLEICGRQSWGGCKQIKVGQPKTGNAYIALNKFYRIRDDDIDVRYKLTSLRRISKRIGGHNAPGFKGRLYLEVIKK